MPRIIADSESYVKENVSGQRKVSIKEVSLSQDICRESDSFNIH